jgi:hypothetical protein
MGQQGDAVWQWIEPLSDPGGLGDRSIRRFRRMGPHLRGDGPSVDRLRYQGRRRVPARRCMWRSETALPLIRGKGLRGPGLVQPASGPGKPTGAF